MTFIEFIGFIIILVAMIFLSIKRAREKRELTPEELEEEQQEKEEMMREMFGLEKQRSVPPSAPLEASVQQKSLPERFTKHHLAPSVGERMLVKQHLTPSLEKHKLKQTVPREKMQVLNVKEWGQREKKIPTTGVRALETLRRSKDLVILHAIFSLPKAWQNGEESPLNNPKNHS